MRRPSIKVSLYDEVALGNTTEPFFGYEVEYLGDCPSVNDVISLAQRLTYGLFFDDSTGASYLGDDEPVKEHLFVVKNRRITYYQDESCVFDSAQVFQRATISLIVQRLSEPFPVASERFERRFLLESDAI